MTRRSLLPRPINLEKVVFVDHVPLIGSEDIVGGAASNIDESMILALKSIFPSPPTDDDDEDSLETFAAQKQPNMDGGTTFSDDDEIQKQHAILQQNMSAGSNASSTSSNPAVRDLFESNLLAVQCLLTSPLREIAASNNFTSTCTSNMMMASASQVHFTEVASPLTAPPVAMLSSQSWYGQNRPVGRQSTTGNLDSSSSSVCAAQLQEQPDVTTSGTQEIHFRDDLDQSLTRMELDEDHAEGVEEDSNPSTISSSPGLNKKKKTAKTVPASASASCKRRFRALKSGQWFEKYQELVQFQKDHGDCNIPLNNPKAEHESLAKWVKRQRYQYNLKLQGKHSNLTDERKDALDEVGFVWSCHGAKWEDRFEELLSFSKEKGHCNVPRGYEQNPQLANWVKCQRRQYRWIMQGKGPSSTLTPERIDMLEKLGFSWGRKGDPDDL